MSKLRYIFFLSIVLLILIDIASAVNDENTFYTRYYEDFVEGEDLTINLGVLDTLKFTYYNQNYSLRVLGVYSKSATIRIEKRGFDVNLDQTLSFNFDSIDDYDLEITLIALEDHTATFRLELNEKPSDEDDDEQINDTNSTDTSDSDDDDGSDDNSDDDNDNSDDDSTNSNSNSSSSGTSRYIDLRGISSRVSNSSTTRRSSTTSTNPDKEEKITGADVIDLNFNLTLTTKSGVLFLIGCLLLGVIFVFHRASLVAVSRISKKRKISKFSVRMDKFRRKFKAKSNVVFKKIRMGLGEFIAGKEFENMAKAGKKKR